MSSLSWDEVQEELSLVEEAMIKILGVKPKCTPNPRTYQREY
jgi:hypothetical protein